MLGLALYLVCSGLGANIVSGKNNRKSIRYGFFESFLPFF
jgi:hypothetical protein